MASRILVSEKGNKDDRTYKVYSIDADLTEKELYLLGRRLFADPVTEQFCINSFPFSDNAVEINFRPGVKDNVGGTAREAIGELLGRDFRAAVSSSVIFSGPDIEAKIAELHPNELLHHIRRLDSGSDIYIPKVRLLSNRVRTIRRDLRDDSLLKLSRERVLALNLQEMRAAMSYFNSPSVLESRASLGLANPTDCELEMIAQTWSEHCKHKIFNAEISYSEGGKTRIIDGIFDTFIKSSTKELQGRNPWIISTLWDNAGVVRFNENLNLVLKGETHNSPSGLDPYGGAITGIVGVYRDILGAGMGAEILMGLYGFCTPPPDYSGSLPPKIPPKILLEEIVRGVRDGGNKSGIPTPYGMTFFDEGFLGKPGVYVAAVGRMPAYINGKPSHEKSISEGDLVVVMGGRTGADGIHGATFSSEGLHEGSPSTAVQIGDPIMQKKLMDFQFEARNRNLYNFVTDNGAGGISSSVGESARYCGANGGCEINLDLLLTKYANLAPWQLLVSESQERMTFAVSPSKISEFMQLASEFDVEGSVIGKYTDSGKFTARYKGRAVVHLDMDFLHDGVPKMKLQAEWKHPHYEEPVFHAKDDYTADLLSILSRDNIRSQEWINRQYDHEVQGLSVVKHIVAHDGLSDAVINRVEHGSNEGVVVSMGFNPRLSKIDSFHMASNSLNEAIQRNIAVGGSLDMMWLNDNFCWPNPIYDEKSNPDGKYKLAQLVRANQALHDYALAFNAACISGKDSMSMDGILKAAGESKKVSALPSLLFTLNARMPDVRKAVTMDVKFPGDLVYVIGETRNELGASEYLDMNNFVGNDVPEVDAEELIGRYNKHAEAALRGLIASSHGIYRGGLAVALAQSSFAGDFGIEANFESNLSPEALLFSETAGRFVITVNPENRPAFEKIMGSEASLVGRVREDNSFAIGINGRQVINADISALKAAWRGMIPEGNTDSGDLLYEDAERLASLSFSRTSVRAAVLWGYGINCDAETMHGLEVAGAIPERIHINELISGKKKLSEYDMMFLPGGFSFGDDIASGKVYANKLKVYLEPQVKSFVESGRPVIGVCNGAQIGIKYGMVNEDSQEATFTFNDSGKFECRWVVLEELHKSPFTKGIGSIAVPVAHGEGKFAMTDKGLYEMHGMEQLILQYDGSSYPRNPNGSEDDVAAVSNVKGNVLLMMPHPERNLYFESHPSWTRVRERLVREGKPVPEHGSGVLLLRNAVEYARDCNP